MAKYIDYAFKQYVLQEHKDLIFKARKSTLIDYYKERIEETGEVPGFWHKYENDLDTKELFDYCKQNNLLKEFKEAYKINHAFMHRTQRLQKRIESMLLNGTCIFLTLTFTDKTLADTSEKERRVAVTRYLKQFKAPYIANIDFGSKNKREHYHAIINTEKIDYSSWRKYGQINGEKIRNKNIGNDVKKLAKYVAKLTNHAIKETTKRSCLIYSR